MDKIMKTSMCFCSMSIYVLFSIELETSLVAKRGLSEHTTFPNLLNTAEG